MKIVFYIFLLSASICFGQYPPAANVSWTEAIYKDSSVITNWAFRIASFQRGPQDIAVGTPFASFGDSTEALGYAEGTSTDVVSLGDGGEIVLEFSYPIMNGSGPDFAVFENGFSHDYLEFAHVEVSTDGINFVRFPSHSLMQTTSQTGPFANSITEQVDNLAGKYIQGYGTPFDLEDIIDSTGINLDSINFVKIVDVVGSVDPSYGTEDSQGNLINDPYPTAFESGGFDLDAVAVINENNIFASTQEIDKGFEMFPNPATDIVYLSFRGNQIVTIYDLAGRLMFVTDASNHLTLEISQIGLQKGVYIVKIGDFSRKLIIN